MAYDISRRHFFFGSLLAGAMPAGGFGSAASLRTLGYKSPNEKLNIASIGAGGKAASDIDGCAGENIVALCDVDEKQAARKFAEYDKVPKYKDFRKMLDEQGNAIDAVIVTIPDFMHATAAMWCMERGKHVYVQKPLTRTVWEARQLQEAANKYKVATQMGNQGYSNEGTRQAAEMIWAGEIGNVTEVHAWTDRPIWPQGLKEIPPPDAAPETLDWDLWLGIAEKRPYTSGGKGYPTKWGNFYQPFNWRGFYDFGCGALGDMACHILGAPNLALRLGAPTSVECIHKEGASDFMFPEKSVIRYDFPARGTMPPLKLFWHDGCTETPKIPGVPEGELLGDLPRRASARRAAQSGGSGAGAASQRPPRPPRRTGFVGRVFDWEAFERAKNDPESRVPPPDGSVFIGDKGMLTTGTYGEETRLIPVEQMRDYKFPPPLLTRSPGHYRDWIRACKGGDAACSNFNVAVPFVEWMLLGVVALRFDGKLEWDAAKMRFANNSEANKYLKPAFRKGWSLT
ncbi:MAG TPA: Gfo/Idh/MocA family oxidoreductase [Bryobacterales bacterium]|nr:Gfo/Idh/MocA family oxidoreductase [Bryobacterales bacterium]